MALTSQEAIYVKEVILHGNKLRAVRKSFPLIKEAQLQDAIIYMEQNPLVARHIEAGILYIYKDLLKRSKKIIPEPQPLTTEEQRQLLQLVIAGERKVLHQEKTEHGLLQTVLVPPNYQEVEEAKWLIKTISRMSKDDLAA
ncbi:MAG: hypothetical protein R2800_08140 [Flavipsychrobacter sp.]